MQVIFDAATQLIKQTFTFYKSGQRAAEMFKNKAQFTMEDLIKATKDNVDNVISMEKLVTLFEHHNILAPLPVSQDRTKVTYFMPCILRSATKNEIKKTPVSSDVAPLIYRYKCGYLPLGVFSSLIISLVSKTELDWTLQDDKPCRNKVSFFVGVDYDSTLTLIAYATFIKVKLYKNSFNKPTSAVCASIRSTLTAVLKEVNTNLKYFSATLQYGFRCQQHKSLFKEKHLSILEHVESKNMRCLKDRNTIVPLTQSKQAIWFQEVRE